MNLVPSRHHERLLYCRRCRQESRRACSASALQRRGMQWATAITRPGILNSGRGLSNRAPLLREGSCRPRACTWPQHLAGWR